MNSRRIMAVILAVLLLTAACVRSFAARAEEIPGTATVAMGYPSLRQEKQSEIIPAVSTLTLPCKAAVLMCSNTGGILYEDNPDNELPMASITKVMTLLLAFEDLESGKVRLTDTVPVTEHAYSMGGSQIWLEPGEIFTLDEMIKAICVNSANDAAVAVAEFLEGSEPAFVQRMNLRAQQLGLTHTCFQNACGLDACGHYSSARDIAVMSLALMQHQKVFDYTGIWTDTLRDGATQLTNTNKLLRSYEGITGLKTGTTGGAGVCISATATRNGTGLIAVILGAASSAERFEAAKTLLDYGFANYSFVPLPDVQELPGEIAVSGGTEPAVQIVCEMPQGKLLSRTGDTKLRCTVILPEQLTAPVAAGQQVGQIDLYYGDTLLECYPITARTDMPSMTVPFAMRQLWNALLTL